MSQTQTVVPSEDSGQSAEEQQALIDRADGKQTSSSEGDTLLAGKFKTVEELEKGYKEAQKLISSTRKVDDQGEAGETQTPEDKTPTELEIPAPDGDNASGEEFSIDEYVTSYQENDGLTDEDYAKLAKQGYSKTIVDNYINGQIALNETTRQTAFAQAGGEEAYKKMVTWAASNLTDSERTAYDNMVNDSPEARQLAIEGLKAKYVAANGTEGSLVGGTSASSGVLPFQSRAQVTEAMRDPRYKSDPAYRSEVEARMAKTTLW